MLGELISYSQQLSAGVSVGEGPYAQAVRGVQLPLQELTAGFLNLCQLQQACSGQQRLDITLLHCHLRTTPEVNIDNLCDAQNRPHPLLASLLKLTPKR